LGSNTEQVRTYAPGVNNLARVTRMLQIDAWIKESETRNARCSTVRLVRTYTDADLAIQRILDLAGDEIFEDGIETEFSRALGAFVKNHGNQALDAITHLIISENINEDILSEALRWLGRIDHAQSHKRRLWLLERCLQHSSARVRDAASLGLASLDDAHAIPYLKQAIELERVLELREDLKQVLEQLETTRSATRIEKNTKVEMV
jgi:hypothetical protein